MPNRTFVIQFDGDLYKRGLVGLESWGSLERALERIVELFLTRGREGLPDSEDDRVLIWESDPEATPSMKVVWAFIGDHFSYDGLPGLTEARDLLPDGRSLKALTYDW